MAGVMVSGKPEFVINSRNYRQFIDPKQVGREMGCIPRDFQTMPFGSLPYCGAWDMTEMTDEEINDRIADQEREKSSLEHIREDFKIRSLDQDGYGYCWAFSSVKALMMIRAAMNLPFEELSAWAVGAIVKNYRNQGGWCQQSLEFLVEVGCPSLKIWPQGEVKRSLDTPAMRADAATRKVTEWMDMQARNKRQLASNLLRNIPTMMDLNWWGHSVCGIRLKSWNPFRVLIDNSWAPSWGTDGMAVLEGSRAVPDNMASPRVAMAA